MFYEGFVKYHADKVDLLLDKLFAAQLELIEAYKRQWAEMNYLIENGLWNKKAVYLANTYGLKVDKDRYVFQLSAPLPFLPNPYYMRFKESKDEFIAAKLIINLQLRDVINKLGPEMLSQPAALLIKHYYSDVRLFDMDNKAKQVLINTFREKLIIDDNVKAFSYYSEEAIQDEENRTMLYLCPAADRQFMEDEITSRYNRIDHLPEAIIGEYPKKYFPKRPQSKDNIPRQVSTESQEIEVNSNGVGSSNNRLM